MNLRYLLLINTLVTACAFSSCSRAGESMEVKDYKAQCDQGEGLACAILGEKYEHGKGVTKDFAQAAAFFRKACDMGDAGGCHNLGVSYEKGTGVKKSNTDALNYYEKACDMMAEVGCEAYARLKKKMQPN